MAAVLVDLGAVPVGQPVALVLAQNREPPPGKGDEFGKAFKAAFRKRDESS